MSETPIGLREINDWLCEIADTLRRIEELLLKSSYTPEQLAEMLHRANELVAHQDREPADVLTIVADPVPSTPAPESTTLHCTCPAPACPKHGASNR